MEQSIENQFKSVVEQVFNNWTALQLAVEHQMGGISSRETAIQAMNWVSEYCLYQENLQINDLTEALEDILDEEFETICEDGSPKNVAQVLLKFLQILREGNNDLYLEEYAKLPTNQIWLSNKEEIRTAKLISPEDLENETEIAAAPATATDVQDMEVDSEWTMVRRKK